MNESQPSGNTPGFRVLIVRLSPFQDIQKSTPHLFLYGECRRVLPDDCIDFAWFPSARERRQHSDSGKELMNSVRYGLPASAFDLILISNSYALELLNLPYILREAGIPLLASQRTSEGTQPLIILGGSNALASQSVMAPNGDALVDALFFGEGERAVTLKVAALMAVPLQERRKTLASLMSTMDGLFVFNPDLISQSASNSMIPTQQPSQPLKIRKSIYHGYSCDPGIFFTDYPVFDSEEASTTRIQLAAGCPSFCTFCFEGWERKPYREVPLETLLDTARKLKHNTGADTIELSGFNFNTHQDCTALITGLNSIFSHVNFMSQRADILADHPELVKYEVAADKRSYTIGIEGLSTRMRTYYHKELPDRKIMQVITLLLKEHIREIKLFYILSGTENAEDIAEFSRFLRSLDIVRQQTNPGIRFVFSFGLLVRMPFTPLCFERLMLDADSWTVSLQMVREATTMAGYEFRLAEDFTEYCLSQTLVMTPYPIAPILVEASREGHLYDQSLTPGAWEAIRSRMEQAGYLPPGFLAEKTPDYPFAFGFLDTGTSTGYRYQRFLQARSGEETPSCLGDGADQGTCSVCGACTLAEERLFLTHHSMHMPNRQAIADIGKLMKEKAAAQSLSIQIALPEHLKGTTKEYREAWVLRTLFAQVPSTDSVILSAHDTLFETTDWKNHLIPWYGDSLQALTLLPGSDVAALRRDLQTAGIKVLSSGGQTPPASFDITIHTTSTMPREQLEKAVAAMLTTQSLPATMSRRQNATLFTLSPKALKKKEILFLEIVQITQEFASDAADRESFRIVIKTGGKFNLCGLCQGKASLPPNKVAAEIHFSV
ncbi:MAG: radical SAM protein [Sphaerochaetaceae bacterium]